MDKLLSQDLAIDALFSNSDLVAATTKESEWRRTGGKLLIILVHPLRRSRTLQYANL